MGQRYAINGLKGCYLVFAEARLVWFQIERGSLAARLGIPTPPDILAPIGVDSITLPDGFACVIPLLDAALLTFSLRQLAGASAPELRIEGDVGPAGAVFDAVASAADAMVFKAANSIVTLAAEGAVAVLDLGVAPPKINVFRSHADLVVQGSARLSLRITSQACSLRLRGVASFSLNVDLFRSESEFFHVAVNLVHAPGARLLRIDLSAGAGVAAEVDILVVTRDASALPLAGWRPRVRLGALPGWEIASMAMLPASLASFPGAVLGALHMIDVALAGASAVATWANGRFTIEGLTAQIGLNDRTSLSLVHGSLALTDELVLVDAALNLSFDEPAALLAGIDKPFTVVIQAGATARISLDEGEPSIALGHKSGVPAKVYVPGIVLPLTADQADRIVLEVMGDEPMAPDNPDGLPRVCRLMPGGAEMHARLLPQTFQLGNVLRDAAAVEGSLHVYAGEYVLSATATARLPYFEGATGTLSIAASSRDRESGAASLHMRFDARLDARWTDPSGVLELQNPSAWAVVGWNGAWSVTGGVGGKLVLKPAKMGAFAASWLEELFQSVEIDFDGLALDKLATMARDAGEPVKLSLRLARPLVVRLWKLMDLTIDEVGLHMKGFHVGGNFRLEVPKICVLAGRLPRLGISLAHGTISLGLDTAGFGASFALQGTLTLVSGIRAALELERRDVGTESSLGGAGALMIPGLPELRIACRIGRILTEHAGYQPLLFLFLQADLATAVAPGVVLRNTGLGFGVNEELRGFTKVLEEGAKTALADPQGMPDPSSLSGWEAKVGTVMIAARTYLAPSPDPTNPPYPYVADVVLGMNEHGSIVLFTNLWLFTSLADAATPHFRQNPALKGVISLFPQHRRFEGQFTTCKSAAATVAMPMLTSALELVQTEASFLATPELFRLRIGPVRAAMDILGVQFRGQAIFAIQVSAGRVIAAAQLSLSAAFSQEIRLAFGPVRAGISLSASFAYESMYAGGLKGGEVLMFGRAWTEIRAELRIDLEVGFQITLRFFRWKKTISWSEHFSASLGVLFSAQVSAVIGTGASAVSAAGQVAVRVFGFDLDIPVRFEVGNQARLTEAASLFGKFLAEG